MQSAESINVPKFSEKNWYMCMVCGSVSVCVCPSSYPIIAKTMVYYLPVFQAEGKENQWSPLLI